MSEGAELIPKFETPTLKTNPGCHAAPSSSPPAEQKLTELSCAIAAVGGSNVRFGTLQARWPTPPLLPNRHLGNDAACWSFAPPTVVPATAPRATPSVRSPRPAAVRLCVVSMVAADSEVPNVPRIPAVLGRPL